MWTGEFINPFPTRVKYTQQLAVCRSKMHHIVFLNIFLQWRLFRAAFLSPITFVSKIANIFYRVSISETFNESFFSDHSFLLTVA